MRVNTLDINYLVMGQGEPLVIIHGGGDGASAWWNNAKELSKNYRVYVPDLPGFGNSESMSEKFKFSNYITFIEDFTHGLGIERFHLIGHSIGACIALQYALNFSERVKKLVLVSSFCLGKEVNFWVRFFSSPIFCNTIGRISLALIKAFRWFLALFRHPLKFTNPISMLKIDMGKRITTRKGQSTVLLSQLSTLFTPTLIVWGEEDRIVPASHCYAAANVIPDCQTHVFKGCGHIVYKQRIPEFSRLIDSFFSK